MALATTASAQPNAAQTDEEKSHATEVWSPVPKAVDILPGGMPSDASILFDGGALGAWESVKGGPAGWDVADGAFIVHPGTGDIRTKQSFCDVQLHVEWMTPTTVTGKDGKELTSQQRNNSGVFLQERYEVQVLDSYNAATYVNGQAGSIYKQSIPLVNPARAPGEWQTYDIIYAAPKFDAAGAVTSKARITVLFNGVLVQNNFEIQGPTAWVGHPPYETHGCAPLRLQDHGNPIRFRNIWVRPL
ncbi:MAG: DUF1080 domain-containing protein [Asticcacaulis sp.]|nr:DUF1080 domain-containing protein [Asticcacaulis sp.]